MQFTRNMEDIQVTQGLLCVTKLFLKKNSDGIKALVAPLCVRELPSLKSNRTKEYTTAGWRLVTVKETEGLPQVSLKKVSFRRIEYPLKPSHASTIHKCIGDDLPSLATQTASTDPSEKKLFRLCERNELLVLFGCFKKLKDLILVGPKSLTLATICKICSESNQWNSFLFNFVTGISQTMFTSNILSIPISQHFLFIVQTIFT